MRLRLAVAIVAVQLAVAQTPVDRPHLVDCGPTAFAGQTLCVCGNFPAASSNAILLDGKPLGTPSRVSRESLTFTLPETITPGAHILSGQEEAGFSPADSVVTTVLGLAADIDQNALVRG